MNVCNIYSGKENKSLLEKTVGLNFKRGMAGKHFKKHRNDPMIKMLNLSSSFDYVNKAREVIRRSILDNGYVIRLGSPDRIAFFRPETPSSAIGYFVSVGYFDKKGGGRISTFYPFNGTTSSKVIKEFRKHAKKISTSPPDFYQSFIAYFKDGKSDGWKIVQYDAGCCPLYKEGRPKCELNSSINFFNLE